MTLFFYFILFQFILLTFWGDIGYKIIWVSHVDFCDTRSVYGIVSSTPKVKASPITIYLAPTPATVPSQYHSLW